MSIPLTFIVFDLLRLGGTDVTERPYSWWRTADVRGRNCALLSRVRDGLEDVGAKQQ